MRRNLARMVAVLAGSAMLATGAVAAQPRVVAARSPVTERSTYLSDRASALFAEINSESVGLRKNADTLGGFARGTMHSWQSHAHYLEQVKNHINAVGERIVELQRIHHSVLPWQQQAIAGVTTHAAQVAASTQAALVLLKDSRHNVLFREYRDHLRIIDDSSAAMKEHVSKFLSYEETQQKFHQLQRELEVEG